MTQFFLCVTEHIRYEGPQSNNPLAFRWYHADRIVAGRRMEDGFAPGLDDTRGFVVFRPDRVPGRWVPDRRAPR